MSGNQSKPVKKHSPGPWTAVKNGRAGFSIVDARGYPVGVVNFPDAEGKANAAAMAAAPELLAALESLLNVFDRYEHGDPLSIEERFAARDAAQAVVAKARGEG